MAVGEVLPEGGAAEAHELEPQATLDPNELEVMVDGYGLDLCLAVAASKRALLLAHARYARQKAETDRMVPSFRVPSQRKPSEA